MATNKVELLVKNQEGQTLSVDILDFPYRFNRTAYTVSEDRLKILGGTFSTQIKLAKSKKNNQLFKRNDWKSIAKFYLSKDYTAVLLENGSQIAKGVLKIEGIASKSYDCIFLAEDIDWLDKLSAVQLNKLGYVDGQPTWLATFNGASSFNVVNEQTNRQTDYICPTIVYNNTPITDYLDLTDDDIWGTFELPLAPTPVRLTEGGNFPNDFITVNGYFGDRLGLTFEDFPPAIYYRNLLEKIFAEIDMNVDCSLFNEDWFNALYLPYVGNGYEYNWKRIAKATSRTPLVPQSGLYNFDGLIEVDDISIVNIGLLPNASGGAPIDNWFSTPKAFMKTLGVIKHDNPYIAGYTDYITAFNKFDIPNQYIVPSDNNYTINVSSGYNNFNTNFVLEYDTPSNPSQLVWRGVNIWSAYASQDPNSSQSQPQIDRWYGWDDNVLVVMRKTEGSGFAYSNTLTNLIAWMNGMNDDFVNEPSDVIAYVSPKRYRLWENGDITNKKLAIGSPITNWETDVEVVSVVVHQVVSSLIPDLESRSYANISISLDMLKNERIEIYWISLGMIEGKAETWISQGQPTLNALDPDTIEQAIGFGLPVPTLQKWEIIPNCGTEQLDLARNLPTINGKQFISSFVKQFNLFFTKENNTVRFLPQKQFYTPEVYDITPRVVEDSWDCQPFPSGVVKNWEIAYDNDNNDRLLIEDQSACIYDETQTLHYANVILENDNVNTSVDSNSNEMTLFSATKFVQGIVNVQDLAIIAMTFPTSTDPSSDIEIIKGIDFTFVPVDFPMEFPSIQSRDSFSQDTVGELTYDYNYSPRILYHLGTINTYLGYGLNYQVLVDSPRADSTFVSLPKHWFRPTVSAFDDENGNIYPTLRYDTENGLFNRYFENLVDLYNRSEILTLEVALRSKDWINLTGSKKVRYQDQLFRLMEIKDYSPLDNRPCTITLLKEI